MSVYGSAVEFVKELYKMQKLMIKERLNFGARALMINIMLAANASPRQMSVEITDGELMRYTGMSHTAITANKRRLKNKGLVDFTSGKRGTTYYMQVADENAEKV